MTRHRTHQTPFSEATLASNPCSRWFGFSERDRVSKKRSRCWNEAFGLKSFETPSFSSRKTRWLSWYGVGLPALKTAGGGSNSCWSTRESQVRPAERQRAPTTKIFAVLCNPLVSGGNTLSHLVMAADDQCETAGISLRDESSEGTTWKVLLVIILFSTTLAVRWIYICYHNRRIRQMRAEYGDLDISEAHDSDEWMAFHYNVQFPDRADPILTVTHVYSIDVHIQLCSICS